MSKLMILKANSDAIHKMGNIKRNIDDLISVHSETKDKYIGNFVEGFGFIDVEFNKKDCRNLTEQEVDDLKNKTYTINGNYAGSYTWLKYDGTFMNKEEKKELCNKVTITSIKDHNGKDKHGNLIGMIGYTPIKWQDTNRLELYEEEYFTPILTTSKVANFKALNELTFEFKTKNSIYRLEIYDDEIKYNFNLKS